MSSRITAKDIQAAIGQLAFLEIPMGQIPPYAVYSRGGDLHGITLYFRNERVGGFTGTVREVYAYALALQDLVGAIVQADAQRATIEALAQKKFGSGN